MATWFVTRLATSFFAVNLIALTPAPVWQQSPAVQSKTPSGENEDALHRITLPALPAPIPEGPNVNTFRANCLLCHSARYVTMQPPFSSTVWQNEVKKMITAYGAAISDADRDKIVDYLMTVRGIKERSPAAGINPSPIPK